MGYDGVLWTDWMHFEEGALPQPPIKTLRSGWPTNHYLQNGSCSDSAQVLAPKSAFIVVLLGSWFYVISPALSCPWEQTRCLWCSDLCRQHWAWVIQKPTHTQYHQRQASHAQELDHCDENSFLFFFFCFCFSQGVPLFFHFKSKLLMRKKIWIVCSFL